MGGEQGAWDEAPDAAASSSFGLTHWHPAANAEELRDFYQRRLALFTKIFFWIFVVLLIWVNLMYWLEPVLRPDNYQLINIVAGVGLVGLGIVWRVVLTNTGRSQRSLVAWDIVIAIVIGAVLGFASSWSLEKPANVASMLVWALLVVFARVSIIPSRGTRTMLISFGALAPQIVSAIYIVIVTEGLYMGTPKVAFVVGCVIYVGVAVLLAGLGSEVLYGLRKQVAKARRLGQYTLTEKIGEGGMGAVYKAKHALLRRPTALKMFAPEKAGAGSIKRFEREVQLTSELTSVNTIEIYDYGRTKDVFYYVMEYLEGINLEQLVVCNGPQSPARVVHILTQVCLALEEAHDRGLIHRDVKPANIILCWRGNTPDFAKVLDFGLVKDLEQDLTTTDVIAGTPAYLAPEVINEAGDIGPTNDIYAMGATAFFLLTGRLVFPGSSLIKVCMDHINTPPERASSLAPEVKPDFDQLILDCLAKEPADRPQSARELRERLLALDLDPWTEPEAAAWWAENPIERGSRSGETSTINIDFSDR